MDEAAKLNWEAIINFPLSDSRARKKELMKNPTLKPYLAVAYVEQEDADPKILYSDTMNPIFAASDKEAEQHVFTAAVRADPDVAPKDVVVCILPFHS